MWPRWGKPLIFGDVFARGVCARGRETRGAVGEWGMGGTGETPCVSLCLDVAGARHLGAACAGGAEVEKGGRGSRSRFLTWENPSAMVVVGGEVGGGGRRVM